MSELLATYILADPGCDAEKRAEQIAIGLTVGSWTDLPLLKQEQLKKHKGRVVNVEETESELGGKTGNGHHRLSGSQFYKRHSRCADDRFWKAVSRRKNQIGGFGVFAVF